MAAKLHGDIRLGVVRSAAPVGFHLAVVELGEILAEVGVGGEAVVASVDLGDGKRDPRAGFERQRAFAERVQETEITFQRRRTVRDQPEKIRRNAELLFDGLEERLRRSRGGVDRSRYGEAGHWERLLQAGGFFAGPPEIWPSKSQ